MSAVDGWSLLALVASLAIQYIFTVEFRPLAPTIEPGILGGAQAFGGHPDVFVLVLGSICALFDVLLYRPIDEKAAGGAREAARCVRKPSRSRTHSNRNVGRRAARYSS